LSFCDFWFWPLPLLTGYLTKSKQYSQMQLIGFDTEMNELVFLFWFIKVTLFVFDKSFLKYGGTFLFLLSIILTVNIRLNFNVDHSEKLNTLLSFCNRFNETLFNYFKNTTKHKNTYYCLFRLNSISLLFIYKKLYKWSTNTKSVNEVQSLRPK